MAMAWTLVNFHTPSSLNLAKIDMGWSVLKPLLFTPSLQRFGLAFFRLTRLAQLKFEFLGMCHNLFQFTLGLQRYMGWVNSSNRSTIA